MNSPLRIPDRELGFDLHLTLLQAMLNSSKTVFEQCLASAVEPTTNLKIKGISRQDESTSQVMV